MRRQPQPRRCAVSLLLTAAIVGLPHVFTAPARMWRVVNLDRIEVDWSVSELQFLTATQPAPSNAQERTGNPWPLGAGDWQTPFACVNTSALTLSQFPSHRILSSYEFGATPSTAAFDGSIEFGRRDDADTVWRSGVAGLSLEAGAGFLGVDFGRDVDVRCMRITQGEGPMWGSERLELQSSPDGVQWTSAYTETILEYPLYEYGTNTLIIQECSLSVDIGTSGVLNFTGLAADPRALDCAWTIECGGQNDVAAVQLTEFRTTTQQDLLLLYDGDAYQPGAAVGSAPEFLSAVPQLHTYQGSVPPCTEDADGYLGALGLDCTDGSECMECIPTWRGCRTGTSLESCPPIGSPSLDGRNSTCIAGSPASVHQGLDCATCGAACTSALSKLGSCGGDISTLPNSGAPTGTLLSAVCPILCSSPCPGELQATTGAMSLRYTADGAKSDDGFVLDYTCQPLDDCGVSQGLGGDGSTCAGCDGISNSGALLDECGVCGGNGESCKGCDGVRFSGLVFDSCGICGGDRGTSCADPCDSPHGMHMENAGSIDFGSGYANGESCEWHFFCPDPQDKVLISFSQFATENTFDYIEFFEGETLDHNSPLLDDSGQPVGRLSGHTIPGPFQSVGTTASMAFVSNRQYNFDGFLMTFACGTAHTGQSLGNPCTTGVHMTDGGQVDFLGASSGTCCVAACGHRAGTQTSDPSCAQGATIRLCTLTALGFSRAPTRRCIRASRLVSSIPASTTITSTSTITRCDFLCQVVAFVRYTCRAQATLGNNVNWQTYSWDSSRLFGCNTTAGVLAGNCRHSGNNGPQPVIASGQHLTVRFTSNPTTSNVAYMGFDSLYSCEQTLTLG